MNDVLGVGFILIGLFIFFQPILSLSKKGKRDILPPHMKDWYFFKGKSPNYIKTVLIIIGMLSSGVGLVFLGM